MAGPARTLGRRRACAIGSGVWQAMMGGKGGLGVVRRPSMRRRGHGGLRLIAKAMLESPFPASPFSLIESLRAPTGPPEIP